jgi:hypothetical protein
MSEPRTPPSGRWQQEAAGPMTNLDGPAVTAGCLYLMTGSVSVTLIGTAVSAVLAGWRRWLASQAAPERDEPQFLPAAQPTSTLQSGGPGQSTALAR